MRPVLAALRTSRSALGKEPPFCAVGRCAPIRLLLHRHDFYLASRRAAGAHQAAGRLATEIVGSRRVLFTAPVVEKMKIQTIGSALAFKAGDPVETALRTALIAAICLKFDDQLPSRPRRA